MNNEPIGKRIRLSTGYILEIWPKPNKLTGRFAILGVLGGYKLSLEFSKEDMLLIQSAMEEAMTNERTLPENKP